MSSSIQIYPDDGLKVLKLLKSVTKTTLPDYGLLAGQAVCSALLYMKGQDSNININDLDIFIPIHTEESNLYAFEPHHAIPRPSSTYSVVDRVDHNGADRQKWRNNHYKALDRSSRRLDHDDYQEIESEAYRLFPEKKENYWRFTESSYQLGYKILSVFRRGLKNIIFTGKPRRSIADHKSLFSFDMEAMKVLKGFDLNCVQVGIDLRTGKIFYTPEFVGFLHSKQLRILQPYRPWHTIIRYYQKKDCHGYYGNDELAIAIVSTFHDLRTPHLMEDLLDLEPDAGFNPSSFYGHNITSSGGGIPRFGTGYIDKYKSIANLATNHFDLRIDNVSVNKKTDEKYLEKAQSLPDKTQLGSLSPRYSGVGSILGGSHRKSLQKQLGIKILNYPAYARCNIVPIIENKFGLYGKRLEKKRSSLISGAGRINSRKNPFMYSPFLNLITDKGDSFKGDIYQEGLQKVSDLLKDHRELVSRFSVMTLEDQIKAAKRMAWLEKHQLNYAFHIISGNVLISNNDLIHLPTDELVDVIGTSYEKWKKEQLKKPALTKELFPETKLTGGIHAIELVHNSFLLEEGNSQRHCVGGYGRLVKQGHCRIISFRKTFNNRVTMEVIWSSDQNGKGAWIIRQFKTRANRKPKEEFYIALEEWVGIMREKGISIMLKGYI